MTEPTTTDSVPTAMDDGSDGYNEGLRVLSYLIAGVLFYGGLGWVGDHYLGTGFLLPLGLVLGMAGSIYLIIKRYGQSE